MKKLTTSQQLVEWCGMVSVAHYCANGIWESKVYLDNGEIRHCLTTTRKLNRMTLDEAIAFISGCFEHTSEEEGHHV